MWKRAKARSAARMLYHGDADSLSQPDAQQRHSTHTHRYETSNDQENRATLTFLVHLETLTIRTAHIVQRREVRGTHTESGERTKESVRLTGGLELA